MDCACARRTAADASVTLPSDSPTADRGPDPLALPFAKPAMAHGPNPQPRRARTRHGDAPPKMYKDEKRTGPLFLRCRLMFVVTPAHRSGAPSITKTAT
eukprot:275361-Prymnesium_polylepis.1